ncbi:hypothetical protein Tco_0255254 [Tanacetum coccineum]
MEECHKLLTDQVDDAIIRPGLVNLKDEAAYYPDVGWNNWCLIVLDCRGMQVLTLQLYTAKTSPNLVGKANDLIQADDTVMILQGQSHSEQIRGSDDHEVSMKYTSSLMALCKQIDEAIEQGLHFRYPETAKDTMYLSESGELCGWKDPRGGLPSSIHYYRLSHSELDDIEKEILLKMNLSDHRIKLWWKWRYLVPVESIHSPMLTLNVFNQRQHDNLKTYNTAFATLISNVMIKKSVSMPVRRSEHHIKAMLLNKDD